MVPGLHTWYGLGQVSVNSMELAAGFVVEYRMMTIPLPPSPPYAVEIDDAPPPLPVFGAAEPPLYP